MTPAAWLLLSIHAGLCVSGCAHMAALEAQTAPWQARVDVTVRHYQARPLPVRLTGGRVNWYMGYEIQLSEATLRSPYAWVALAHELGHHVLQHRPGQWHPSYEMDANAEGVRILTLWGLSEQDAYTLTMRNLYALAQHVPQLHGHAPWCVEVQDMRRRYPRLTDPQPASCSP